MSDYQDMIDSAPSSADTAAANVCSEQTEASSTPAAANSSSAADPAPVADAPGPGPGDASNPMAGVSANASAATNTPAVSDDTQGTVDAADQAGKIVDGIGTFASVGAKEGTPKVAGATGVFGAAAGLASDAASVVKGVDEIDKAQDVRAGAQGMSDAAGGVAGVVSDVAGIVGNSGVASAAGAAKGGIEAVSGVAQIADAATTDAPKPGESGRDTTQEAVNGVENLLKGAGDMASAAPGPVGEVGKAFSGGMAVGNAIAPAVFGDKNESMGDSNMTADGQYHGSTGNRAVDWVAGIGKYSDGRW